MVVVVVVLLVLHVVAVVVAVVVTLLLIYPSLHQPRMFMQLGVVELLEQEAPTMQGQVVIRHLLLVELFLQAVVVAVVYPEAVLILRVELLALAQAGNLIFVEVPDKEALVLTALL